jgi:hypothetical protein
VPCHYILFCTIYEPVIYFVTERYKCSAEIAGRAAAFNESIISPGGSRKLFCKISPGQLAQSIPHSLAQIFAVALSQSHFNRPLPGRLAGTSVLLFTGAIPRGTGG